MESENWGKIYFIGWSGWTPSAVTLKPIKTTGIVPEMFLRNVLQMRSLVFYFGVLVIVHDSNIQRSEHSEVTREGRTSLVTHIQHATDKHTRLLCHQFRL